MTNHDLQVKFKSITDQLENLKIEKAKAETTLESLQVQREAALKEIQNVSNVATVEEAKEILLKLQSKLDSLAEKAEKLLYDEL